MLIHNKPEGVSFERQSFKEWFVIRIIRRYVGKVPFPKWYFKTHTDYPRDIVYFWVWYLWPIIKVADFAWTQWWMLGRWFYEKGLIHPEEGVAPFWFWPKYFFKKLDKK